MSTLKHHIAKNPVALSERLFRFERSGRYLEALEELNEIWPDRDATPQIDGFEARAAAELLLRCGSLIGFQGHNTQQKGSQERSRDLLMTAHSQFLVLNELEKLAECENYLALSYWRTGEQNEAQIWIDESFSRNLPVSDPVVLFSHIIQCLINIPAKKDSQNLAALKSLEAAFLDCDDDCLKGDFYNHCGLALDNLGRKAEAVEHFELAKYYHLRSGHTVYLGTVENNLAWLYKDAGKFGKAHEATDNAVRLFRQIKDRTREGFSLDTKAALLFAESKYGQALKTAELAISFLENGENTSYLVEAHLTRAKILLYLDNFADAVLSLTSAVHIANVQTGEATAKRLIAEFEAALSAKNKPHEKKVEAGDFELLLPASIGNYSEYRGIWINNTGLEGIGLTQGSLAVIANAPISRGDLVALSQIENDEVSCGFFDSDFGVVCLEGTSGEPRVFDEKEVRILGKIVGVCEDNQRKDGKMAVKALKL